MADAQGQRGEAYTPSNPVASQSSGQQPGVTPVNSVTPVIRTPDQRIRVFVSSTLQELAPERGAAREAITGLRLIPVMFEMGARPHPPRDLYRAYLEQSHIFIGIYWQRYGWVAPDMDISGLEDEYNLSEDKPRLMYMKTPSPGREPRLQEMLKRIQDEGTVSYRYFSTSEELREFIENDLALLLTERFEATAPSGPGQAPPQVEAPAPTRTRTNLPAQRSSIIGRERELGQITDLLMRDSTGLLTLTGPGGTGKSRLGLQVAANVQDRFADGVYLVSLASISDPNLVVPTIARALDLREAGGTPILEVLKNYLRDKRLLLLLDNFEQVIAAARVAVDLLQVSPTLKILVTSRTPLHLLDEREYPVPPLELPKRGEISDLQELSQNAAVQFFIRRSLDVKPDFKLTRQNAPAVVEICHRLDGLPLAIELAAARMRILPPEALLLRLQNRLKLLTGGARDVPARQQTLRGAIEWSHDLLDSHEKELFRRLSVFQGGSTLEAIEGVCNPDGELSVDVLDGVQSLIDKSLLRQEEVASTATGGEPRFVMLETIHEYASEMLEESGEAKELRGRHALYFMRLAEEAEPELKGANQSEWLARLEADHNNFRAALRWTSSTADAPPSSPLSPSSAEIGLRMAGAVWRFWYMRGYFSEGREALATVLSRSRAVGTDLRACTVKALNGAAVLANLQGDYDSARALDYEGLATARELGDKQAMPPFLDDLGIMARQQGDYEAARSFYEESLAIRREIGDRRGIAMSLDNLGIVFREQGNDAAARSFYEESLAIRREIGDKHGIAFGLSNLGNALQAEGDYASARSALEESLALRREIADKRGTAISLNNLGAVAMLQGDYEVAESSLEEGLALVRELGDRQGIAYLLNGRGNLARAQEDYPTARSYYEQSLAIRRDIADRRGIATTLTALASVTSGMGGEEGESAGQTEVERVERSVRLMGAANALLEAMGAVLEASDRLPYERSVAYARSRLGEERFNKAWEKGRTMSWEQAVGYALLENAS